MADGSPDLPGIVTLTTDFGLSDSYVAEMKAAILSRAPRASIIDISHTVEPGDIETAAFLLSRAAPRFPSGTIHLAVVDPGVGTDRRALLAEAGGHVLIGPDNGLLPAAAELLETPAASTRWFTIGRGRLDRTGVTFDGRDLFGPLAGMRLAGEPAVTGLLMPATDPVRIHGRPLRIGATAASGRVVHVDRYGNCITDLPNRLLARTTGFLTGGGRLEPAAAYAEIPDGRGGLVAGSAGTIEIAIRNGSAARLLGFSRGDPVTLDLAEE